MSTLPRQKIPRSEKTPEWGKNTINAIIDMAQFGTKDTQSLFKLYDAYHGKIDKSALTYVTNPYNTPDGQKLNYPARLRNYNIIKPIVNTLVGEKSRRPFEYTVTVRNPDVKTRQDKAVQDAVSKNLAQMFINELNAQGMDTGMESQETPLPEDVAKMISLAYKDSRSIMGQQAISYLKDYLDLPDWFQQGFLHFCITGEIYSYKNVRHDDAEYEIIHPADIWFPRTDSIRYVEDADMVVRKKRMSVPQIIDSFYDLLKDTEIDALEDNQTLTADGIFTPALGSPNQSHSGELEVLHVCWASMTPLVILTFTDETGQEQEMLVDEIYKALPGEKLEKFWIREWWEGWRIDNRFWLGVQPCTVQRRSMSNLSVCKGPYNGFRLPVSPVMDMLPYQDLYNIFHYRLELSIAKNKDKIALMNINMIPKKAGWDEDKFMYYAEANGFAWVDPSAEGQEKSGFQQWQVLDMSLGQYIAAQFELLQAIKRECEEIIGFTPQRKGQVLASAANGATERAVFQSSVITEELFRQVEKFQEKELQGLLDLSKHMWRDGKKSTYLSSDYRQAVLDIDGEDYPEADLGIFVRNGAREQEKIDVMRQSVQAYMQNGGDLLTVAEVLDLENFAQIKQLVAQSEEKRKAYEQQQQEAEQQMQQQQIEAQNALQDRQEQFVTQQNQDKYQHEKEIESMRILAKSGDGDDDNDGTPDWKEAADVAVKREQILAQERDSLRTQQTAREGHQVAREKIEADKIKARAQKKAK